jgi:hypothetical protein
LTHFFFFQIRKYTNQGRAEFLSLLCVHEVCIQHTSPNYTQAQRSAAQRSAAAQLYNSCWPILYKRKSAAHSVFNMSYSQKAAFTCAAAVSVLLVLILAPIHQIQGFPNGAPTTACGSMIPGHGVGAQQSSSPFMTELLDGVNCIFHENVCQTVHLCADFLMRMFTEWTLVSSLLFLLFFT